MSPCSWTVEHLLHAAGSFGIVLEHAPMANRASLERMRAIVAVPDLVLVPENVGVWVRGILREVVVMVHAWIEEPIPNTAPPDTTPPKEFFDQVSHNSSSSSAQTTLTSHTHGKDSLSVDFEILFAIWPTLDEGTEKKIEGILKTSPLFTARLGATAARASTSGTASDMLVATDSGELEGTGINQTGHDSARGQGIDCINDSLLTVPHVEIQNILPRTVHSVLTVPAQSSQAFQRERNQNSNNQTARITTQEVDSAGAQILESILSGPDKSCIDTDPSQSQAALIPPKTLHFGDSPNRPHQQPNSGPIEVGLYPKELTGGVSLPANVHSQIAANIGPHRRCLQPYLPLPPTPLSHPWLYIADEIDSFKEKLIRSATEPDEVPP